MVATPLPRAAFGGLHEGSTPDLDGHDLGERGLSPNAQLSCDHGDRLGVSPFGEQRNPARERPRLDRYEPSHGQYRDRTISGREPQADGLPGRGCAVGGTLSGTVSQTTWPHQVHG